MKITNTSQLNSILLRRNLFSSSECFCTVPAVGRPPVVSVAPGSWAADFPSSVWADPADPSGGWPRRQERTLAAQRQHCWQSPPWHDGTEHRYVKPGTEQREKEIKYTELNLNGEMQQVVQSAKELKVLKVKITQTGFIRTRKYHRSKTASF